MRWVVFRAASSAWRAVCWGREGEERDFDWGSRCRGRRVNVSSAMVVFGGDGGVKMREGE